MPISNERRRWRYKNDPEYKKRLDARAKKWRENNKQYIREYERTRYADKSKNYATYQANYRKNHREETKEYNIKYRKENRDRIRKQRREYYLKNRDAVLKKIKECRDKNGHQYYLTQKAKGINTCEATRKHNRKLMAKRKRNLAWIELAENRFEGCVDWHHITDDDVIAVPRWIHNLCKHPDAFVHRSQMLSFVFQLYPDLEVKVSDIVKSA